MTNIIKGPVQMTSHHYDKWLFIKELIIAHGASIVWSSYVTAMRSSDYW